MKTEDIWQRVDQGGPNECWEFTGATSGDGYGSVNLNGKTVGAHRIAWEAAHGPIPPGLHVLHKCDHPSCCNPGHLFLGTHADNMADRSRKGRTNRESRNAGSLNGYSRLTEETVRWARGQIAAGRSRGAVARDLNVHRATVGYAVAGKTWRHVQ